MFSQFEKTAGKLPVKCRIVKIVPDTIGKVPDSADKVPDIVKIVSDTIGEMPDSREDVMKGMI